MKHSEDLLLWARISSAASANARLDRWFVARSLVIRTSKFRESGRMSKGWVDVQNLEAQFLKSGFFDGQKNVQSFLRQILYKAKTPPVSLQKALDRPHRDLEVAEDLEPVEGQNGGAAGVAGGRAVPGDPGRARISIRVRIIVTSVVDHIRYMYISHHSIYMYIYVCICICICKYMYIYISYYSIYI